MLFCTAVPPRMYEKAAMGGLLAVECENCRKNGKERHDISLLGSLAHHYFLCPMLDNCVVDHLSLLGSRRNAEAAHAEVIDTKELGVDRSREKLNQAMMEAGQELGHMAEHIGEIEKKMLREIELYIHFAPERPPLDELMRIPVRLRWPEDP
jgi:hypothetical protein